jgi:hypothetical protein
LILAHDRGPSGAAQITFALSETAQWCDNCRTSTLSPVDLMRETKTGHVALRDDGVLIVRIQAGAHQSVANAEENLGAALAEREGRRRPLLIDIRGAKPLEAEVRHYYSGQVLIDGFTALGLLVDASPLGTMMGNVYFRVARPGIPTRLFTSEDRAHDWLRGHLA